LQKEKKRMSINIKPVKSSDIEQLCKISKTTFIESHGHCASADDVQDYINRSFNLQRLTAELQSAETYFYFIRKDGQLAGYSKIIINSPYANLDLKSMAKFERLYLLEEFHGLGMGKQLFSHNLQLARSHSQQALWLFVWVENHQAIRFYQKNGFQIIDEQDFKISEKHSNPNHIMLKQL